jgi:acyl-CoA synthetase (AMP-forming)/AMP-acid ligase II
MTSILHTNKPKKTTGEEIVEAINKWSISACFLSPPSAINLSNYLENISETKIPTLERLYVGGESVPSEVVRNIEPHLSPNRPKNGGFHLVYGATEGFPLCQNQAKHIFQTEFETKSGKGICLGTAVKGVRIRILTFKELFGDFDNSSAVEVSGDSIGEISVSGPVVYTRLVGDDEELFGGPLTWALDENDGSIWHRTGDLGYTDDENRIWLVGRKKHRVELSNGITLYPKQIEPVLDSMFGIRTALVNGPNNIQASIIVEDNGANWNILQDKLIQSIPILCELLGDDIDFSFTLYSEEFPVDSGHEAKIRREELSHWLCDKS